MFELILMSLIKLKVILWAIILFLYSTINYGLVTNLWLCQFSLIITAVGLILNNPLLISISTISIFGIHLIWILDFLTVIFNLPGIKVTSFIFDSSTSTSNRILQMYHIWHPIILLFLTLKYGYDKRAFKYWGILCVTILFISFFIFNDRNLNVNFAYGFYNYNDRNLYSFVIYCIILLVFLSYPTHCYLSKLKHPKHLNRLK